MSALQEIAKLSAAARRPMPPVWPTEHRVVCDACSWTGAMKKLRGMTACPKCYENKRMRRILPGEEA